VATEDASAYKHTPWYGNFNTSVLRTKINILLTIRCNCMVIVLLKFTAYRMVVDKQFITTKMLSFALGLQVHPSIDSILDRNHGLLVSFVCRKTLNYLSSWKKN
jgi:hypothetical protein